MYLSRWGILPFLPGGRLLSRRAGGLKSQHSGRARSGTDHETDGAAPLDVLPLAPEDAGGMPKPAPPHLRSQLKHPCLELEWLRTYPVD